MGLDERWLGVDDEAAHPGVGKDSVYRWVESRGLPARKVGRLLRFKLSAVDAWVQDGGGESMVKNDLSGKWGDRTRKKPGMG